MKGQGRPIRFLALVSIGWIGARLLFLWYQTGSLPHAIEAALPSAAEARRQDLVARQPPRALASRRASHRVAIPMLRMRTGPEPPSIAGVPSQTARVRMAMPTVGAVRSLAPAQSTAPVVIPPSSGRISPIPDRWSASGWLVARAGTGLGAAPGSSQLGGGQAGLRVAYLLIPSARIAAFARVASPLRGRGAEASLGLEWQPTRAPVRLVAEQRFGLDGTRGGTGIGLIAGLDSALANHVRLESYGQAGVLLRERAEPYADGALRVIRELFAQERIQLALGAGLWGAAQRDAQRLDVGPSATLAFPVGQKTFRVALDWRQRVAGRARPGSGPALTLGADF